MCLSTKHFNLRTCRICNLVSFGKFCSVSIISKYCLSCSPCICKAYLDSGIWLLLCICVNMGVLIYRAFKNNGVWLKKRRKTGTGILQWPVKEIESLRSRSYEIDDGELILGSVVPQKISSAAHVYTCIISFILLTVNLIWFSLFMIPIKTAAPNFNFSVNAIVQLYIVTSFEVD